MVHAAAVPFARAATFAGVRDDRVARGFGERSGAGHHWISV